MTETPAVPPRPVLVARCENYREGLDTPCTGRIHFRWGQSQAACDTCGAYCGVAVAAWERVEVAGAVPDTGQARESALSRYFAPDDPAEEPILPAAVAFRAGWDRAIAATSSPSRGTVQAPEPRPVYPQVWCDDSSGPNGIGGTCVLGPGHLHRDGLGGEWPVEAGGTVQAPGVAELRAALQRVADVLDFADGAEDHGTVEIDTDVVRLAMTDMQDENASTAALRDAVRALLGTDTTPDRLAWISEAAETAAAERQARYQETACALRPAEETRDA